MSPSFFFKNGNSSQQQWCFWLNYVLLSCLCFIDPLQYGFVTLLCLIRLIYLKYLRLAVLCFSPRDVTNLKFTQKVGWKHPFLSAADRRRRRRCMSGNVRPSVCLSVCPSRTTCGTTCGTEVRSMRNRYGWCILLTATYRHRFHGWMISRFSAAAQKLVIFSKFFTFLRTPPTFLIEGF